MKLLCFCSLLLVPYFSSAQLKSKGKFEKSEKTGTWEYFNEKEELIFKINYPNGELLAFVPQPDSIQWKYKVQEKWENGLLERPPVYIGGEELLFRQVFQKLAMPEQALKLKISGTVQISFIITNTGSAVDFKIVKSIHPECDAQALKLVSTAHHDWLPGVKNNKTVATEYIFPVHFNVAR